MSGAFDRLSGAQGIRVAGKSAQNIAEFRAQIAEQNAKAARLRSGFAQQRQAEVAEANLSQTIANLGAAGAIGSPVAIDIGLKQISESELENLLIGFEGERAEASSLLTAALERAGGKLARQQAKSAARAANISFAISIASLGAGFLGRGTPTSKTAVPQTSSPFLTGTGGTTLNQGFFNVGLGRP